jgi:nitrite reductase/ring-hydroxylating ferredoxin subunit
MTEPSRTDKPDLRNGIADGDLADGAMLVGQVGDEQVLLARRGGEVFAIGAACTHYGGPLCEGLMVGDTVRCPWHHACFSLRTGEALAAPALTMTSCWRVERRDGRIFVHEKAAAPEPRMPAKPRPTAALPKRIVIVGGGAAGFAAAEMLRREGFDGRVTIVSADDAPLCDHPNLSKDYLSGTAPEEWIPLRPTEFYTENTIELRLETTATALDVTVMLLVGGPVVWLFCVRDTPTMFDPGVAQHALALIKQGSSTAMLVRKIEITPTVFAVWTKDPQKKAWRYSRRRSASSRLHGFEYRRSRFGTSPAKRSSSAVGTGITCPTPILCSMARRPSARRAPSLRRIFQTCRDWRRPPSLVPACREKPPWH